jgi:hypothetical protein
MKGRGVIPLAPLLFIRMLKMASSCVLVSLKASTYRQKVRLGFSLTAALPDGHFEHPVRRASVVYF